MTWALTKRLRERRNSYTYQLRCTTDTGRHYLRDYTRTGLRDLCDIAADALEGTYTSSARWTTEPLDQNRIIIVEHRTRNEEHPIFTRVDLAQIIHEIDTHLED